MAAGTNGHVDGLWKRHFHWKILLGWDVLAWLIGIILAVAALLLVFDQYWLANVCFMLTALFMLSKVIYLATSSTSGDFCIRAFRLNRSLHCRDG